MKEQRQSSLIAGDSKLGDMNTERSQLDRAGLAVVIELSAIDPRPLGCIAHVLTAFRTAGDGGQPAHVKVTSRAAIAFAPINLLGDPASVTGPEQTRGKEQHNPRTV